MIFPDLPRSRKFVQKISATPEVETPLEVTQSDSKIVSADEWFARHFPDASAPVIIEREPFDWRKDPVGLVKITVFAIFMVCWAWYWHQFQ